MTKPKIIITIEVDPPKNGARAILVSGAPAGEIPEIRAGAFADLHQLVNQVWAALQRREEMKPDPRLTASKDEEKAQARKNKTAASEKDEEDEIDEGETTEEAVIPDPAQAAAQTETPSPEAN